jgi:NTP pyrophosphatase (non-canonical NTP hydrolase)
MSEAPWDLAAVRERLRTFTAERDWEQFHSPKNLAMALAGEAGELLEIFQWLTDEQSRELSVDDRARVSAEIADVLIYLVRLADVLEVSLPEAVEAKLAENERKYPVELAKGNATKYSHREDG